MGVNDCEACTTCDCGRTYCRDNEVSPGEMEGKCSDCWAELLAAHDGAGWVSEWSQIADNELGSWVGRGWSA